MKLTADAPVKLTGGKTPVAPVVEIHEMVMDGRRHEVGRPAGRCAKPGLR